MKSIIIFVLLVCLSDAISKQVPNKLQRERLTSAIRENVIDARIAIGGVAQPRQFKFAASLLTYYSNGDFGTCGGALISPVWVITAAHCLFPSRIKSVSVFLGSINKLSAPFDYEAERRDMVFHHAYNDKTLENDIALIHIPTVPTLPSIAPIALPRVGFVLHPGSTAFIMGWGRTSTHGNVSPTLLYAKVRVISNKLCRDNHYSKLLDSEVCANSISGIPCHGDSGGPLVSMPGNFLVGVLSFNDPHGCLGGMPDGYTRITFYLDWIRSITGVGA